ncbi:MAG: hypothetical protein ACPGSB_08820 [Opitutales bacterium]
MPLLLVYSTKAQYGSSAEFKLTVSVIDDAGEPIQGANVWIPEMALLTDVKGLATVSGQSSYGDTPFRISKEGYYESGSRYLVEKLSPYDNYTFERSRLGRWLPWNPTFEVVLKKIKDPIPMYTNYVELMFPSGEEARGFDLFKCDWVAPHGEGKETDILFRAVKGPTEKSGAWDYELEISFPNEGDGFIPFRRNENDLSLLISDQLAPEDGYDLKNKTMLNKRLYMPDENYPVPQESYDRAQHYYLRVRTRLDPQGNVLSTHYGKIYSDFFFGPTRPGRKGILNDAYLRFQYYLNPEPNDRRMEFEPGKNLIDTDTSPHSRGGSIGGL